MYHLAHEFGIGKDFIQSNFVVLQVNKKYLMTEISKTSSEELSGVVVKGMQEKKAFGIVMMDLREIPNSVADFFILCSGTSDTHLDAILDSIDAEVSKELKENPWHIEGKNNKEWKLIDYIDVVAHVFKKEAREYYDLEGLWGDAKIKEIETSDSV